MCLLVARLMQRWQALSVCDFDQQATVVTCTPLRDAIHGAYLHALVEAARGENVVQLVLRSRRGLRGGVVRRHGN